MVTAATIHMSLLGLEGLAAVALRSQAQTAKLVDLLTSIDGVTAAFSTPHFHEAVIRLNQPVGPVLEALADQDILGGYDLTTDFPELGNALLICATETKTDDDLESYARALSNVVAKSA